MFHIHGKDFGIYYDGGMSFDGDATGPDPDFCETFGFLGFDCDDNDNNCNDAIDEGVPAELVPNGESFCEDGQYSLANRQEQKINSRKR